MAAAVPQPQTQPDRPSLQKQRLLSRFAAGELTLDELSDAVLRLKPPRTPLSAKRRFALVAAAFITALLIPPWARRDDD
jgi:hypothetical protein